MVAIFRVNRTQLTSRMSVLDKSLATILPGRNKVERAELRQRITEPYTQSQSKVNIWFAFFLTRLLMKERNGWRNITMSRRKWISRARGRKLKGRDW